MDLKIGKSKLSGKVKIPASKSISHRSIICASLSNSYSKIKNISYSDDIVATIDVMKELGAEFKIEEECLIVRGIGSKIRNHIGSKIEVNVKESGSTFRFLIPILTMLNSDVYITTEGRLIERPMDIYYDIFRDNHIDYCVKEKVLKIFAKKDVGNSNDFIFDNDKFDRIKPGYFKLKGNISSQFISGLLFLLPILKDDSVIEIEGELESKSYVDLTINCLQKFCVKVDNLDYKKFVIKGNQTYISTNLEVENDYSQYAFFHVANELGSNIDIVGMNKNSLQGDKKIVEIVDNYKKDKNYSFDGCNVVDIVPVISLFASVFCKETEIYNISRLRMKESDRIEAVCDVLKKLGANIHSSESSIFIRGVKKLSGGVEVSSFGDHRIAMMVAIAGCVCEKDIVLRDADVVSKSYPDFWDVYSRLGGNIREI